MGLWLRTVKKHRGQRRGRAWSRHRPRYDVRCSRFVESSLLGNIHALKQRGQTPPQGCLEPCLTLALSSMSASASQVHANVLPRRLRGFVTPGLALSGPSAIGSVRIAGRRCTTRPSMADHVCRAAASQTTPNSASVAQAAHIARHQLQTIRGISSADDSRAAGARVGTEECAAPATGAHNDRALLVGKTWARGSSALASQK
jgi:hypothetical protein